MAAGIRAEADLLCISTSRLIAAMVLAWEVLDEASRMAAIEAELRREIDRRAAMRGAEEKTPRGEAPSGGTRDEGGAA